MRISNDENELVILFFASARRGGGAQVFSGLTAAGYKGPQNTLESEWAEIKILTG